MNFFEKLKEYKKYGEKNPDSMTHHLLLIGASMAISLPVGLLIGGVLVAHNNTAVQKAKLMKDAYFPEYFNEITLNGAPIGYISSKESKEQSNVFTVNLSNTSDYLTCANDVPFALIPTNTVITQNTEVKNNLKKCLNTLLDTQTATDRNMRILYSDPLINKYKNSTPQISNIVKKVKETGSMSNYEAIELYELAYKQKPNGFLSNP